jgi:hypothetical protein
MRDAAVWGTATIDGRPVAICVMDFGFMGGSMGAVVGEKVTRAAEHALASRVPLFIASASGGARMQEGTFSLMQLAKTVGAIERLRAAGVPFLSLLSDPTTGGVFASFAVLGDVNLAEPNALIGFAGARVSAGTIAQELPPGFQRSEFLFQHGFLDRVAHRSELRSEVSTLLRYLVAGPSPLSVAERAEGDPLGLPSFRPLSFLSNLAERVLPTEADMAGATNGHTTIPAPAVAPPVARAPARPESPPDEPVVLDIATPDAAMLEGALPEGSPEAAGSEPASQLRSDPATEPIASELAAGEPASGSVAEETPRG